MHCCFLSTATNDEANQRLSEAASRHEAQLARVEAEARRYREQTLGLLTDKEEEISELRTALFLANNGDPRASISSSYSAPRSPLLRPQRPSEEEPDSSTSSLPLPEEISTHCGLVHCAEQHGRL